jgi:aminobenzoyl-glutamate utilization protein B
MKLALALLVTAMPLLGQREQVLKRIDAEESRFAAISRQIWENPELGYQETKSSGLLRDALKGAGFTITENLAGMPTAFVASWGQGKPVLAMLAEFDALPGLSQEALPERKSRVEGAPGHGCGHNLLGPASALGAIAVKEYLASSQVAGTIRMYGTPAEEGGAGKVYLARAGAFEGVDVVLAWHPGSFTAASLQGSLATISGRVRYHGIAAHAASAPEAGRSALDAVMVMAHAIELLREHVPQATRIHYIVSHGGVATNIVPDFAEVLITARYPDMAVLDGIWERIEKCARAGALATGTRAEIEVRSSLYSLLPNDTLAALFDRTLRSLGGIEYTPEEIAFAETLRKTFTAEMGLSLGSEKSIQPIQEGFFPASTDVGDVSWQLPAAQFIAATYAPGTPNHSWQSTACSGTGIGRKGMILAAKTLALSAVELYQQPALVAAARADFDRRRAGFEYKSRIPAGAKPPLNYRSNKE